MNQKEVAGEAGVVEEKTVVVATVAVSVIQFLFNIYSKIHNKNPFNIVVIKRC